MLFSSILILIVAKALPLFSRRISSIHFSRIAAIVLLLSGILSFNMLYIQSIGSGIGIYSGLFQITNISQTIELFLLIIGVLILTGWPLFKEPNAGHSHSFGVLNNGTADTRAIDYSIIVLFSTLGSSLLLSSFDLISIYLSIELQSFGLYILTTLYRNSRLHGLNSSNAGLKYFLLGGLSSAIILLGTGILYSYTGTTQLENIYTLITSIGFTESYQPSVGYISNINYVVIGATLGIILIVIGLLFKIAAAPLHNWSPDVYDETPTIVTIWLTIMPKISIIILLLEIYLLFANINIDNIAIGIYQIVGLADINILKNILLISSFASLIIGTIVGLAQIKIKRLLAYSTISHIGFMLLALAINTEQSVDSFLFYLIQYIITNLNIFLIILAISYVSFGNNNNNNPNLLTSQANKEDSIIDIRYIKDLQGLFFNNPILSLTLSISLFSMAGIPPLIGFFSKQFVLNSALDQGYYFLSILAILVSVISASYYLKIVKVLHLNEDKVINSNITITNTNKEYYLSASHSFIISSLSLFILLFIFFPTLILSSTQVLSLTLFNL